MIRWVYVVLGVGIVVLSAASNAITIDRWGQTGEPQGSAERLKNIPLNLGDWQGADEPVRNPEHLRIAGAEGHVIRKYTHYNGKWVSIMLLCGRSRPISFHPPEKCYGGAGYVVDGPRDTRTVESGIGGPKAEFFTAMLKKEEASRTSRLQIYWAWAPGGKDAKGEWQAVVQARSVFRREPALYKLYVIREAAEGETAAQRDACIEFMEVFLPELQRRLFSKA